MIIIENSWLFYDKNQWKSGEIQVDFYLCARSAWDFHQVRENQVSKSMNFNANQ